MTSGTDHFRRAEELIGIYPKASPKDPTLGDVILAIRALAEATLAQTAATAATIQDDKLRKQWSRVVGR